jgi:hypothetical protein
MRSAGTPGPSSTDGGDQPVPILPMFTAADAQQRDAPWASTACIALRATFSSDWMICR